MNDFKLYSVWIDGIPSPVLSSYVDDSEAILAFRTLVFTLRSDIENGLLESDCVSKMALYAHGYLKSDGCVRGFIHPVLVLSATDVKPETVSECEVVE